MSKTQPIVLESGIFASPETQADAPYQLWQQPTGELVVLCVESRTYHGIETLARWTYADIESQRRAFVRELAAWFYTNGPQDNARAHFAVNEVSRMLSAEYGQDDLDADRAWITSNDLSQRLPILRKTLPEPARRELVEFCGRIVSAGAGVSPSDAQFIEVLGAALGFDSETVTNIVIAAVQANAQTGA